MKTLKYFMLFVSGIFLFASCEEYLDKTPESAVSDQDIFGTYESFQGFLDPNYGEVLCYNQHYLSTTMDIGGEVLSYISWSSPMVASKGLYFEIAGYEGSGASTSLYANATAGFGVLANNGSGIWTGGWRGIRRCNMAIQNLSLLLDATDEEKRFIEGQIYFFRAYFHQYIIEAFGGMPYVDTVFAASDLMRESRMPYDECTERIVMDYDKAIALLPENWDSTDVGGARVGANTGRATKGAALAYKQKALLYAGSPLMNKVSGNDYTYNVEFCKRAAAAGWELIQLANKGVYSLVPFTNYSDMYYKQDGTMPWTSETIWQKVLRQYGSSPYTNYTCRLYMFPRMGGKYGQSVNQTFIDKFEMADGTRYQLSYDSDNAKRWDFRDPRFRKNIIVDRDQWGNTASSKINLWDPGFNTGSDKTITAQIMFPYLIKKYWPKGANGFDKVYSQFRYVNPLMRLAEVYLDYAEAVTAAYGPTGSAPGANLTAVDAINIVRARAGMPAVTAAATGYLSFMDLVWNERTVELCFEGHYWYDIRRWHVGHLPENLPIVDLKFDKAWTPSSFSRSVFKTKIFEDPKHYWLPINRNQALLYPQFYQNPGWE